MPCHHSLIFGGCFGTIPIFIEPILPAPTLYICGGGHIALILAKVGKLLGFDIVVVADCPEYANAQRFPEAKLILAEDFAKAFQKLKIDKSGYVVIATHCPQHDKTVLERALATEAKYIGMMGSKTKKQTIFSHLLSKGISQERLDRVHAPIGLNIHAQTPEEMAISILAEIIKVRRSTSPGDQW